jgi:hypothetical protein
MLTHGVGYREDFQIATRGGKCPHPMRNWEESNLPVSHN